MRMMQGNMLDVIEHSHLFVISTNGILKADGSLVMGAGIAGQIAEKYPSIPKLAGNCIKAGRYPTSHEVHWKHSGVSHRYSFIQLPGTSISLFQVKGAWWESAKLFMIHQSALAMKKVIDNFVAQYKCEPVVHMNFPGIGKGCLSKEVVLPTLQSILPDFVHVWEYAETSVRV